MSKVLGVVGSLRQKSHTRRVVRLTLDYAKELGGEVRLIDLAETPLPMFNPDTDEEGETLKKITGDVLWSDSILLGSPDYHGSYSAPMKNFLDYFWKEFTGRLFGYVIASHEKGLTVQDHLRTAVRQCYGWSLPYGIGFNGDADFEKDGTLKNAALGDRARCMARDLVHYGKLLHGEFLCDLTREPRDPGFAQNFKS